MGLRERMFFIIFVYLFFIQVFRSSYFSLFIIFYFLFIYMFPFCFHGTSALYQPVTIFFYTIKCFRIFDIYLKFLYILDVNKNKFYFTI